MDRHKLNKMSKVKRRKHKKSIGKAPGEVIYLGDKENLKTSLEVYDFSSESINTLKTDFIEEIEGFKDNGNITWINVNGLSHTDNIIKIGDLFKLHPLILEDIVDTGQRPKIDEYESYLFIVIKMLYFDADTDFVSEHVSLVIGKDYVITFQESEKDVFNGVRTRLKNEKSRVRNSEADYLGFALMDAIVDNYFSIIDSISDKVEGLENELFVESTHEGITKDIQLLKNDILRVRRNIFPSREVIGRIVKTDSTLIKEKTLNYYRDLQDQIVLISENIDVVREMIWGLMDMYMTTVSNKMNSIMKVLTIIATIFIPLTFIVGVYGMNFENMPELKSPYGYQIIWAFMIIVFISLLIYFRKKKWL